MIRPVAGFLTGLLAVALVAATVPTGVDAFLEDIDRRVSDLEARVSVLEESSTTTTSTITTSTLGTSSTTTTVVATSTTTTQATTTLPSSIELTSDWIITKDDTRSNFTVDANGFQILIDGADIVWDDFVIRNAARVMWHNACGVANLTNGVISDAGVENDLGFYPLHWHLCGDTTRGSVVENVTVDGGLNHAFVPHGSNGITFTGVTALDTVDDAFWWDPPGSNDCDSSFEKFCTADNSNDITVDGALIDGVAPPEGSRGFRLAGFVLGAGSGNEIRNSTARNVQGKVDCSAFHWPEGANQNVGGNVWLFENNHGESNCHGIFVWQNDSNLHVVEGFTGGGIKHGAYGNDYVYRNADVPYLLVAATRSTFEDSDLGLIRLSAGRCSDECWVQFTNVTGSEIRLEDGNKPSGVDYLFDGTNLTCGDVTRPNAHPDSKVIIDGQEC